MTDKKTSTLVELTETEQSTLMRLYANALGAEKQGIVARMWGG